MPDPTLTPTEGYTEVEYGSGEDAVKITNCLTLKFHQENVMDGSGLDVHFIRYTIRVQGYMLAQDVANTQITPNMAGDHYIQTAGNQHIGLRKMLKSPRKPFKMTMGVTGPNPTIILQADPVGSTTEDINETFDVQGGPKPTDLSITQVVGNTSLKVEWEVVVCISPDCEEDPGGYGDIQRSRGILSNKWTCADDIDENFYLRSRTFVGELKLANPLVNPHDYRQLVVPAISPGMRLKSMNFKCSEDCLTLQYTVTHEEVTVTAPYPATSISISHKVHIEENEVYVNETLSITLKGDRHVDKQELITLACVIADGKIRLKKLIPDGIGETTRLKSMEIIDESGTGQDNKIHAVWHLFHVAPNNERVPGENVVVMTGIRRGIGKHIDNVIIPEYDNTLTRGNRDGETPEFKGPITVVGAFAAHLQSKCQLDHSVNSATEGSESVDSALIATMAEEMELPSVTLDIYPDLDDLPDDTFSTAHSTDGIYLSYQIDSQYSEMPLVFQAPLSASTFYGSSTPSSAEYAAEDGDSSVFIRLGPSQWKRTVRILAERHNLPPRLPEPLASFRDEDNVLNVLLGREVSMSEPQRSAAGDNRRSYVVRAEYVYGMSRAPAKFRAGAPDTDAVEDPESESSLYSFTLATIFSSDQAVG
jgi:hypothetical protein